jgi:bile acid-coenzyme A ligase
MPDRDRTDDRRSPLGVVIGRLAAAAPDAPAITDEHRTVTRAEFEARTNRLARAYAGLGVEADDMVSIGLPNSIEWFESVVATWKVGATPQPLSARMPALEQRAIVELARPALVVGLDPDVAGGFRSVAAGFEPPGGAGSGSDDPLPPAVARAWKAPTSGGSTGRPKLIVANHRAQLGTVEPVAGMGQMLPNRTQLVTGPLYHNGPFMFGVAGLLTGNHQVVMTRFDASRALALVELHKVDWMYAVPTMMQRIWRLPDDERLARDLSSLRIVFHMAAPCPPWLKEEWINWLGPDAIWELYGGTESQAVTVLSGREWLAHRGSVGKPVMGEIVVLGRDGEPLPPGEVGEVWLRRGAGERSPYRYIGAEAKRRDDGWESLGDIGRVDEDGYLYIADRETDMILVGGANVYPAEVEAALDEHPLVGSCAVIGLPHEDLGSVPHAILHVTGDISDDELASHLRQRLATYKIPRTFERSDEPLRDDAGKVRRSALRAERL